MGTQIFRHELKKHRRALLFWGAGVIALMFAAMTKYSTIIEAGDASMTQLIAQLPQMMQAMFGMADLDITSLEGYFGICFLYLVLMLAVHAGLLGAAVIGDEERDKTTEFLYVKPIRRSRVITEKLTAGVVLLLVLWVVSMIGSWVAVAVSASTDGFLPIFMVFMQAAFIMQLVFFSLGVTLAAVLPNYRLPGKIIAGVVFAEYFLYVLSKFAPQFDGLRHLTIFRTYDAVDIVANGQLDVLSIGACIVMIVVVIAIAYCVYPRLDLGV